MPDKNHPSNATVIWFTGLSGAGKTTLATEIKNQLELRGVRVYLLDGDQLRSGLNADLGFSQEDRTENIRRAAEIAKLLCDEGYYVLATFISPFEKDRSMARRIVGSGRYREVFVQCPLVICEQRDVKGLYKKARSGAISQFTGIDSPYEEPRFSDIIIHTDEQSVAEAVNLIFKKLL
ncbi:MAG TPA: adenylyl-sulfate kinase [Cyclobacteriaceae bacterium]|nr:adenylyl-sulfate kinase [Cyclobacteriaceae bacterium]HPW64017.1 adenylyl-sulfate kinase [Cyclobacteriaceae bacterium]HRG80399.1 adenylyl-sulfate kinase [Cyclobacteriaceae bacterium]